VILSQYTVTEMLYKNYTGQCKNYMTISYLVEIPE